MWQQHIVYIYMPGWTEHNSKEPKLLMTLKLAIPFCIETLPADHRKRRFTPGSAAAGDSSVRPGSGSAALHTEFASGWDAMSTDENMAKS